MKQVYLTVFLILSSSLAFAVDCRDVSAPNRLTDISNKMDNLFGRDIAFGSAVMLGYHANKSCSNRYVIIAKAGSRTAEITVSNQKEPLLIIQTQHIIDRVDFTTDSQYAIVASDEGRKVEVFEIATGKSIAKVRIDEVPDLLTAPGQLKKILESIKVSTGNKKLLLHLPNNHLVKVYSTETSEDILNIISVGPKEMLNADFNDDGTIVVVNEKSPAGRKVRTIKIADYLRDAHR